VGAAGRHRRPAAGRQRHHRRRRVVPDGSADSNQITVGVRTKVTARKSTATLQAGESFTVTGTVSPNHAGQRVWLQRLVDGAWKTAASATLSGGSGYTVSAKPPTTGRLTYRVYKGADHDHVKAASATLYVTLAEER
jgi:hypothetical protein